MAPIQRSAYITAPTGWSTGLVAEYATDMLGRRRLIPAGTAAQVRLADCEHNDNHTTTWRIHYQIATINEAVERGRPLSLSRT
ncbi:hypothetical protein [Tsukamurella tyrosinosolvens]|uniref:hypothetical protein n=1 Tax=Tsukamurella tyrosinosolvens TaxID=57704 RepID=UPI00125F5D2A|nr:hypothetical protein [Tsukamurella tyrosinosolvens]